MIDPTKRNFRIIAGSLFVLGMAWQQIEATRLGYQVEQARHEARTLRGRIGAVEMQLETGLSPSALASRANAMGMIQSDPSSLRILGSRAVSPAPTFLSRLVPAYIKTLLST